MTKLIITEEEKSRILGMHQSNQTKKYLTEQAGQCKSMKINLPVDAQGNVMSNGLATFVLGGLGTKAAQEYTGFVASMTIGGVPISNVFTNQKLVGETITGSILLKSNAQLISALNSLKGKGLQSVASNSNYLVYPTRKANTETGYKGGSEFNFMCEITVGTYIPAPTQK
jgi:hypothetical protein